MTYLVNISIVAVEVDLVNLLSQPNSVGVYPGDDSVESFKVGFNHTEAIDGEDHLIVEVALDSNRVFVVDVIFVVDDFDSRRSI